MLVLWWLRTLKPQSSDLCGHLASILFHFVFYILDQVEVIIDERGLSAAIMAHGLPSALVQKIVPYSILFNSKYNMEIIYPYLKKVFKRPQFIFQIFNFLVWYDPHLTYFGWPCKGKLFLRDPTELPKKIL